MPKMPTIKDVASALSGHKKQLNSECPETDVRLQVYGDGGWAIRIGDSSYDLDHRGYWGSSFLTRWSNCRELARELIDQCEEDAAMMG